MSQISDEILAACEHLFSETRMFPRERSIILSNIVMLKNKLTTSSSIPTADGNDSSCGGRNVLRGGVVVSPSSAMLSSTGTHSTSTDDDGSDVGHISTSAIPAKPSANSRTSLQKLLTNGDDINTLVYACRVALIGEKQAQKTSSFLKDESNGKGGGSGGDTGITGKASATVARSSLKALAAALELAAVLLNSGLVPNEFWAPEPLYRSFENPADGGTGQMFLSRFFSSRRAKASTPSVSVETSTPDANNVSTDPVLPTCQSSSTEEVKDVLPIQAPSAPLSSSCPSSLGAPSNETYVNVRDTLVDAVIAVSSMALSKNSDDRVRFVCMAALLAAAVPRVSRTQIIHTADDALRRDRLCVHKSRLVAVLQLLFRVLAAPVTTTSSPLLLDEAENAIKQIARALSKHVEQERHDEAKVLGAGTPRKSHDDEIQIDESASHDACPCPTVQENITKSAEKVHTTLSSASSSPHLPFSVPLMQRDVREECVNLPRQRCSCGVEDITHVLEFCSFVVHHAATSSSLPISENVMMPLQRAGSPLFGNERGMNCTVVSSSSVAVRETTEETTGGNAIAKATANRTAGEANPARCRALSFPLLGGGDKGSAAVLFQNITALGNALGIILHVIVNGGPVLRHSEDAIAAMRVFVVPCAIRASLLSDMNIFHLSLNVLTTCCVSFSAKLVNETAAIFRHVYFRVLRSSFTSLAQRLFVVEVIQRYAAELQSIISLFVNYDCQTDSHSIYEEMISLLGALAASPSAAQVPRARITAAASAHANKISDSASISNSNATRTESGAEVQTTPALLSMSPRDSITAILQPALTPVDYLVPSALRQKALLTLLLIADANAQWIERCACDGTDGCVSLSSSAVCHDISAASMTATAAAATAITRAHLSNCSLLEVNDTTDQRKSDVVVPVLLSSLSYASGAHAALHNKLHGVSTIASTDASALSYKSNGSDDNCNSANNDNKNSASKVYQSDNRLSSESTTSIAQSSTVTGVRHNIAYWRARQYKEAMREFYYRFNIMCDAEEAIRFLRCSTLLVTSEGVSNVAATVAAVGTRESVPMNTSIVAEDTAPAAATTITAATIDSTQPEATNTLPEASIDPNQRSVHVDAASSPESQAMRAEANTDEKQCSSRSASLDAQELSALHENENNGQAAEKKPLDKVQQKQEQKEMRDARTACAKDNDDDNKNHNDKNDAGDGITTAAVDAETLMRARPVAQFLKKHEFELDKIVLGDFFAKAFSKPDRRAIFESWIALHNFGGSTLDEALRLFLGGFKLLGEAQVVDKTMELFAAQYCHQNPGVFHSADTAFILSFSICMLNTDAHSPHVKDKMTKDEFLRNNRDIDEGDVLDPEMLTGIYDRICRREIVLRPGSPRLCIGSSAKCARGSPAQTNCKSDADLRNSYKSKRDNSSNAMRAAQDTSLTRHRLLDHGKVAATVLESIPLLGHLVPAASSITDTLFVPMDAVGDGLSSLMRKQREEMYQCELRDTLRDAMQALHVSTTTAHSYEAKEHDNICSGSISNTSSHHATEKVTAAATTTINDIATAESVVIPLSSSHTTATVEMVEPSSSLASPTAAIIAPHASGDEKVAASNPEEQRQRTHDDYDDNGVLSTVACIENALPMWQVAVDVVAHMLITALSDLFDASEAYTSVELSKNSSFGAVGPELPASSPLSTHARMSVERRVRDYMQETNSHLYFDSLLRGVVNTVRVCCCYGNISHVDFLLEQLMHMTGMFQSVVLSSSAATATAAAAVAAPARVGVRGTPSLLRRRLLVTLLNLYISHGSLFSARAWRVGYEMMSTMDALANGVEGLWRRTTVGAQFRTNTQDTSSSANAIDSKDGNQLSSRAKEDTMHRRASALSESAETTPTRVASRASAPLVASPVLSREGSAERMEGRTQTTHAERGYATHAEANTREGVVTTDTIANSATNQGKNTSNRINGNADIGDTARNNKSDHVKSDSDGSESTEAARAHHVEAVKSGAATPTAATVAAAKKQTAMIDSKNHTSNNNNGNCGNDTLMNTNYNAGGCGNIRTGSDDNAQSDVWFGAIQDAPASITPASYERRCTLLRAIRATPASAVDLWLERLFDVTRYPARTRLQMTKGLVKVCQQELSLGRTFAMVKLFDFITTCASSSSRLQWRELWSEASVVFVMAGRMSTEIARAALNALRIIALTYLVHEELLNYSFQKEVLKPLSEILMTNQETAVRQRIVSIVAELVDFRAGQLASGWNVVFVCLSHAAAIPDTTEAAWDVCEWVILHHVHHLKDYLSDLIFCLTSFACSSVTVHVPLRAISYLVACGFWLQYGLQSPPPTVREAEDVIDWVVSSIALSAASSAASYAADSNHTHTECAVNQTWGNRTPTSHTPATAHAILAAEQLTSHHPLHSSELPADKTRYNLWMSLFEGMAPIVVIHMSARVRVHATSCLWLLVQHFGAYFAPLVQRALFREILTPVLLTLAQQVFTTDKAPLTDASDYSVMVYVMLRGMFFACCAADASLVHIACETFLSFIARLPTSAELLQSELLTTLVRVNADLILLAAHPGTTPATMLSTLKDAARSPSSSSSPVENIASRRIKYSSNHLDLDGVYPGRESVDSGILECVLNEMRAMTQSDEVTSYIRERSWPELLLTPLARGSPIVLGGYSLASQRSARECVQETVVTSLTDALWQWLVCRVWPATAPSHHTARHMAGCMRQIMLGVTYYCLVTEDRTGVQKLWSLLHGIHGVMNVLPIIDATPTPSTPTCSASLPPLPSCALLTQLRKNADTGPDPEGLSIPHATTTTTADVSARMQTEFKADSTVRVSHNNVAATVDAATRVNVPMISHDKGSNDVNAADRAVQHTVAPAEWQCIVPYAFSLVECIYALSSALSDSCQEIMVDEVALLIDTLKALHLRRVGTVFAMRDRMHNVADVLDTTSTTKTVCQTAPPSQQQPQQHRSVPSTALGSNTPSVKECLERWPAHFTAPPMPTSMHNSTYINSIYLSRLLCLRGCLAIPRSIARMCMPDATLIELARYVPSEVEESAMHEMLQCLWHELYHSTPLPSTNALNLCLDLLHTRL